MSNYINSDMDPQLIKLISDLIDDPDPNIEYPCSPNTTSKGFTKLMKLVMMTGKKPELIFIIKNMIINDKNIIDIKNEKGWTALMLAVRNSNTNSNVETIKLLIKYGANLNLQTNDDYSALMLATMYSNTDSNIETIKILVNTGLNLNLQNINGSTALMMAARSSNTTSNLETVKILLDVGANINLRNNNGWSALMGAARNSNTNSNIDTVKILIEFGANINLQTNDGWTALMMAASNSNTDSNIETVKILIDAGANLNLQNNNGWTTIMFAVHFSNTYSNIETVKLLIDTGADIYLMNNQAESVFLIKNDMHIQIIKMHNEYQNKLTEIKTIKKINFDRTLRYIPLRCNEIKLKPGNIGSKIMKISFKLKTNKVTPLEIYQKMVNKNNFIFNYLSITSFDHFVSTINAYLITQ